VFSRLVDLICLFFSVHSRCLCCCGCCCFAFVRLCCEERAAAWSKSCQWHLVTHTPM